MPDQSTFVIVGGGLAGGKAAETLRAEGFDGRLVLIGAEDELPYERPPLSKGYLAGDNPFEEARVNEAAYYAEHDVELLTGRTATRLDAGARRVELDDGATLGYDKLLLATGAIPRRPPLAGADGDGVLVLRTVADSNRLQSLLHPGARLAIIGAGWIGCEVAATARGRGADVVLLELGDAPLERVLGRELGDFFARLHRGRGVELVTGARISGIEPGPRVVLAEGEPVECDAVLLGVGVAPAVELAAGAGLEEDDGVVCDELLRTSAPDVFAAGDVASAFHPRYGTRVRVEHWANAADQGEAAARSMLGRGEPYAKVPFFFTDQYDLGLEYFGRHSADDRLVIRGELGDEPFQVFWIGADGSLTAGMHVNDWDASDAVRALVERGGPVDAEKLADTGTALEEAAAGTA
jgi:3-phenylpropionate/trans-cinnamate dioxygenase ferredoxin reductase component